MDEIVELELARLVIQEKGDSQYIHLRQRGGERTFPIVIGFHEAAEINRKLHGADTPRPMTHDLLGRVLTTLGWKLARVVISELKEHTFYANLVLQHDGETREVDCRPSDAIALAVQAHAPIFVARRVLDAVAPA